MDIGKKIKSEREQQQLSREELAEAIGKTVDFVGKVEREVRRINVEDLARVANVLGRPVEFFTGEGEEPEVERELQRLIQSAKLDPADSAELQRFPRLRSKQAVINLVKSVQASHFGLFRQQLFETEIVVLPDGGSQRWWHRRIEVLDRELSEFKFRYLMNYDLRGTSFKGFTVDFLLGRCFPQERMKMGPKHIPGNVVYYSIRFEPPLQRGETAEVSCEEAYNNAYVMTREELEQLIKEEKFLEEKPKERTASSIVVPTDFVRRRITFPRDYDINDVGVDVFVRRMRLHDERERIRKQGCLSKIKVGSRWMLELSVEKPVVGASYHITWQPPAEAAYKALLAETKEKQGRVGR